MIVPFASALLNQVPVVQNTDGRCSTIDAEILRFENGLNEPGALFRYGSYWIPSPTMSRNLPPLVTEKEVRRSLVRESDVGEHKTDVRVKGSGHDPAGLGARARATGGTMTACQGRRRSWSAPRPDDAGRR